MLVRGEGICSSIELLEVERSMLCDWKTIRIADFDNWIRSILMMYGAMLDVLFKRRRISSLL